MTTSCKLFRALHMFLPPKHQITFSYPFTSHSCNIMYGKSPGGSREDVCQVQRVLPAALQMFVFLHSTVQKIVSWKNTSEAEKVPIQRPKYISDPHPVLLQLYCRCSTVHGSRCGSLMALVRLRRVLSHIFGEDRAFPLARGRDWMGEGDDDDKLPSPRRFV